MKVVAAIDSFKGTMSSAEACEKAARGVLDAFPGAQVVRVPVADGGEGTADAFRHSLGGEVVEKTVPGPEFREVPARYLLLPGGRAAVIETAAASGITLTGEDRSPLRTTTLGTGALIADAVSRGCTRIYLGLGGSATNDGGAGILAALGVRLLDAQGKEIAPTGGAVGAVARIDGAGILPGARDCEFILLCDVDNPLCGPRGASAVYGPQKGASPEDVRLLDANLRHYADMIERTTGRAVHEFPGSGAAGGIAAGMAGFFKVEIKSGIETLLTTVDFAQTVKDADLIITGEGKADAQSAYGKVPAGVGKFAAAAGVPAIVVAGDVGDGYETLYDCGISAVFSINHLARPYGEIRHRAPEDLRDTVRNLCRMLRAARKPEN